MVAVGRVRGLFDPVMEALPTLGVLVVLLVGTVRVGSGDIDAGQLVRVAYLFTLLAFPVRAIGWVLNELPRSVVGWDRVQRVLTAERRARRTATRGLPRRAARPRLRRRRRSASPTARRRSCTTSRFDVRAGPHGRRSSAPPAAGKSHARDAAGAPGRPATPARVAVRRRGPARARARARSPRSPRWCRRRRSCSTTACAATSRSAPTCPDEDVWAALRVAQADGFVAALPGRPRHGGRRARHDPVRRPAPAPRPRPRGRAAAAPAGARRRHQRASTRRSSSASWPGCAARLHEHGRRRRLPPRHHRAGRRGGVPRARPGVRPRHARRAARRARPATATWSPRTPGPRPSASRARAGRRARWARERPPDG